MSCRSHVSVLVLTGMCLITIVNAGCERESAHSGTHSATRPGPAQSFKEIAQLVRDGIEDTRGMPNAYVFTNGSTRSQATVHNSVTSELIPPANASDPYRGTITITTRLMYSMRRMDDQPEKKKDDGGSDPNILKDAASGTSVDLLDRDLVSALPPDNGKGGPAAPTVARREDEDVRKCDLVYENDRWVLKTELSKDTEQSLIAAFDRALSAQP